MSWTPSKGGPKWRTNHWSWSEGTGFFSKTVLQVFDAFSRGSGMAFLESDGVWHEISNQQEPIKHPKNYLEY